MKKLLTVAVLASLFAGQAQAMKNVSEVPGRVYKRAGLPGGLVNKKALMNAKKEALSKVSMYEKQQREVQADIRKAIKSGNLTELRKYQPKATALNLKLRAARIQAAKANAKLKLN